VSFSSRRDKVPPSLRPETLTQAAAAVTAWHAASDSPCNWECSRIVVPASEYKPGQPLDVPPLRNRWGEANDVGLRLGLVVGVGGVVPVGQQLPVKQYIRNDGTKALTFSPTQIFNEGRGGDSSARPMGRNFLTRRATPGRDFPSRETAPGYYIALGPAP